MHIHHVLETLARAPIPTRVASRREIHPAVPSPKSTVRAVRHPEHLQGRRLRRGMVEEEVLLEGVRLLHCAMRHHYQAQHILITLGVQIEIATETLIETDVRGDRPLLGAHLFETPGTEINETLPHETWTFHELDEIRVMARLRLVRRIQTPP